MNKLSHERRTQILHCLCEGNSIASTCRITGTAKNTVLRLLEEAGFACWDWHDRTVRNVRASRVQADEIWSFVGAKQKNVPEHRKGEFGIGDTWTWTAIDADTKLIVSWMVGGRDGGSAGSFKDDVASRLAGRVQLTTDGHKPYLEAVEGAFRRDIDYAQLIKLYGTPEAEARADRRYSPSVCTGVDRRPVMGNPDAAHISTSYVERQNLSMRCRCGDSRG